MFRKRPRRRAAEYAGSHIHKGFGTGNRSEHMPGRPAGAGVVGQVNAVYGQIKVRDILFRQREDASLNQAEAFVCGKMRHGCQKGCR